MCKVLMKIARLLINKRKEGRMEGRAHVHNLQPCKDVVAGSVLMSCLADVHYHDPLIPTAQYILMAEGNHHFPASHHAPCSANCACTGFHHALLHDNINSSISKLSNAVDFSILP